MRRLDAAYRLSGGSQGLAGLYLAGRVLLLCDGCAGSGCAAVSLGRLSFHRLSVDVSPPCVTAVQGTSGGTWCSCNTSV